MHRPHINSRGGLAPMKERLSPAELERRQSKHEYRRAVSTEHAKTRGLANVAMSNTIFLQRQQRRLTVVGIVYMIGDVIFHIVKGF